MESIHFLLPLKLTGSNVTATAAGTEQSLKYAASPAKREMMALGNMWAGGGNVASDTFTCDVKLQESPTTVDSDFVDITSAAFTQSNDTTPAVHEAIYFQTLATSKYLRAYSTFAGSGSCAVAVDAFLVKRDA